MGPHWQHDAVSWVTLLLGDVTRSDSGVFLRRLEVERLSVEWWAAVVHTALGLLGGCNCGMMSIPMLSRAESYIQVTGDTTPQVVHCRRAVILDLVGD